MENENYHQRLQQVSEFNRSNENKDGGIRDCFFILYKRRWSVISIFLVIIFLGIVWTISIPETFEASSYLQIGQKDGVDIESIGRVKLIFNSQITLNDLVRRLGLLDVASTQQITSMFDLRYDQPSGFLQVRGRARTPEEALKIASTVTEMIVELHQKLVIKQKLSLESEIENTQEHIEDVERTIEKTKQSIERLEIERQKKARRVEEHLKEQGGVSEGRGIIVGSYIRTLQESEDRLKNEEALLLVLKKQSEDFKEKKRTKELEKMYNDSNTKVKVPPSLPKVKSAPNNRKNVKLAGFMGVFLGILYAFLAEYVSRNR